MSKLNYQQIIKDEFNKNFPQYKIHQICEVGENIEDYEVYVTFVKDKDYWNIQTMFCNLSQQHKNIFITPVLLNDYLTVSYFPELSNPKLIKQIIKDEFNKKFPNIKIEVFDYHNVEDPTTIEYDVRVYEVDNADLYWNIEDYFVELEVELKVFINPELIKEKFKDGKI